ncbi:MAG TPA: hypothetical protein VI339_06320 [Steroidobacteraceae bacterium]|nr:hypothetical protein [Steroidobacteraceae bacterium]
MASLEDRRKPGLPPPPAPTRRSANPWQFSDTARKREPPPQDRPDLLESLMTDAHAGNDAEPGHEPPAPDDDASPRDVRRRPGFGLVPLIVLGMAVVIVLRMLMKARGSGDWVGLVVPLFVILFVAHGWWKLRRRRHDSAATRTN